MSTLKDLLLGIVIGLTLYLIKLGDSSIIFVALTSAILPDLDFLIYHSFNPINRFSHRHRRILHHPAPYILFGCILIYLLSLPTSWYLPFILSSLSHFIHDTVSIGWGIQWFSPFSNKHLFYRNRIEGSKKILPHLFSASPEVVDAWADKYGDDHWFSKQLNP